MNLRMLFSCNKYQNIFLKAQLNEFLMKVQVPPDFSINLRFSPDFLKLVSLP